MSHIPVYLQRNDQGGVVEKIYVRNINMRNIYSGVAKADIPAVTESTPQFRDIHISNVVCDGAEEGIFVRGLPEMNIRDIYLENMVLKAAKGAELAEAQEVRLKNIRLVTDNRRSATRLSNMEPCKRPWN